jgi:hypothetical protein
MCGAIANARNSASRANYAFAGCSPHSSRVAVEK